jgi:hypothetical protein
MARKPWFRDSRPGGIVNSPTLATVGERGPEAIVPLARFRSLFGSGAGAPW